MHVSQAFRSHLKGLMRKTEVGVVRPDHPDIDSSNISTLVLLSKQLGWSSTARGRPAAIFAFDRFGLDESPLLA